MSGKFSLTHSNPSLSLSLFALISCSRLCLYRSLSLLASSRQLKYDKPEPGVSVLHMLSTSIKVIAQQSAEQRYGFWLADEVGRYLYFWTKWNTDVRLLCWYLSV